MKILKKSQLLIVVFMLILMSFFLGEIVFAEESVNLTETPPLVTFIADDGNVADFLLLKPLSDQYNIPFTSAIMTGAVNEYNCMTTEQLNILQNSGRWEFISHTINHPFLATLSDAELDEELRLSQQWLMANNLGNGYRYLAYPYGNFNDRVSEATMRYYDAAFTTTPGLNTAQMDPLAINRIPLGAWTEEGEDNLAYYKSKVDEAIANG